MIMRRASNVVSASLVDVLVPAGSAGGGDPSTGTYSVSFPSTAAAVATDTVQLLVFDVPSGTDRQDFCLNLVQARKRKEQQKPVLQNTPVNICEMLIGR